MAFLFQTFCRGRIPHRRAGDQFQEVSVAFYCQTISGLLLIPRVRLEDNLTGHREEAETFTALRFRFYYCHQRKKPQQKPVEWRQHSAYMYFF